MREVCGNFRWDEDDERLWLDLQVEIAYALEPERPVSFLPSDVQDGDILFMRPDGTVDIYSSDGKLRGNDGGYFFEKVIRERTDRIYLDAPHEETHAAFRYMPVAIPRAPRTPRPPRDKVLAELLDFPVALLPLTDVESHANPARCRSPC